MDATDYIIWDNTLSSTVSITFPGSTDKTISLWIKQSSSDAGGECEIFNNLNGASAFGGTWYYSGDSNWYWDDGDQSNGRLHADFTSHIGAWTHIVMTGKGDNSAGGLFFNGSSVATRAVGNTPTATMSDWVTMRLSNVARFIDEFRIAPTVRSNDWITAEYNNQSSLSSFWSKGSITSASGPPVNIQKAAAFLEFF
jgi:hypothetical protein